VPHSRVCARLEGTFQSSGRETLAREQRARSGSKAPRYWPGLVKGCCCSRARVALVSVLSRLWCSTFPPQSLAPLCVWCVCSSPRTRARGCCSKTERRQVGSACVCRPGPLAARVLWVRRVGSLWTVCVTSLVLFGGDLGLRWPRGLKTRENPEVGERESPGAGGEEPPGGAPPHSAQRAETEGNCARESLPSAARPGMRRQPPSAPRSGAQNSRFLRVQNGARAKHERARPPPQPRRQAFLSWGSEKTNKSATVHEQRPGGQRLGLKSPSYVVVGAGELGSTPPGPGG
jgi:hypothetical protein